MAELSTIRGILALTITGEQSYHHHRASLQPSAPTLRQWVMQRDEPPRAAALAGEGVELEAHCTARIPQR